MTRNDDAISPVVGVIIMVAVVVILAAIIASFIFGLAGYANENIVPKTITVSSINNRTITTTDNETFTIPWWNGMLTEGGTYWIYYDKTNREITGWHFETRPQCCCCCKGCPP